MARGDDLQLDVRGAILLSGPLGSESEARSQLELKLRLLFANLNDPLVCERFAATGIAEQTAERIAQAPWVKYKVIAPAPAEIRVAPFVAPAGSQERLAELNKQARKARGKKKQALEMEARSLAMIIGHARIVHEASERKRIAREIDEQKKSRPPVRVFVTRLHVKYRNPPNPQWKWWAQIENEQNTVQPGTFTSGP